MIAVALAVVLSADAPPVEPLPAQTVVFYNARIAQRQKHPREALTLWLWRNSLTELGYPPSHDGAFHSVVWAATGAIGVCQDGFPLDDGEGGAGLWPLGLHNYVLTAKQPDDLPSPFDAFEVGRQQRLISLSDVLDREELESVTFSQTACLAPRLSLLEYGGNPLADLDDRLVVGPLLRRLLVRALKTVRRDRVTSVAAVEARLFDLELALTDLRRRSARERAADVAADVRGANMSDGAARQAAKKALRSFEEPAQRAFLRRALRWEPAEWLTLSRARREYLFANASPIADDPFQLRDATLGIVDALVAHGEGDEAQGFLASIGSEADRALVTEGARGERLLALDDDSGFRERAVISLRRGVRQLERGELSNALRSFAFSLAHSDGSRASTAVHSLARRWLSYVLARYETNAEALATLKVLVPRQDFNPIVEDLIWSAALRGDVDSFERLAKVVQRGGSFDEKVRRLSWLAHGKPAELVAELKTVAPEGPWETNRFLKQLLEVLEREEAEVRRANRALVEQTLGVLDGIANTPGVAKTNERQARELGGRAQALLEAMGTKAQGGSTRAMELSHSAFAGSLRLAPADPLPWPFSAPEVDAPSAFTPFVLVPIEWRDEAGQLVFGWRITE